MKIRLLVLTIITALGVILVKVAHGDKIYRDGRAFTVLIQYNSIEGHTAGSGILIDRTHVLTCAHMVDKEAAIDQTFMVYVWPLGQVIKAHPDAMNSKQDIAMLVLEDSAPVTTAPYFESHIEPGDAVTIIGNALGAMEWLVERGVISGYHEGFITADASIQHGDSGGPWLNDNGDVVGMSDWIFQPKDGCRIAGAVSAANIKNFLNQYKHKDDLQALINTLLGGK
jgi:S1-C subfamily serine protease